MSAATPATPKSSLSVHHRPYGTHPSGAAVTAYTLKNTSTDFQVELLDFGGIISSVLQPDSQGNLGEVVLGYDNLNDWVNGKPWFNSLIGRNSNRIAGGTFTIDGVTTTLAKNNGNNNLHSGPKAFNAKCMASKVIRGADSLSRDFVGVEMTFLSPDGDDGFPGDLTVGFTAKLFADDTLQMEFTASVDKKPTVVNMCNHAYWNLSGLEATPNASSSTILAHELQLYSESTTELTNDGSMIPTGKIVPTKGTPLDFATRHRVDTNLEALNKTIPAPGGFDHNYVLKKDASVPTRETGLQEAKQATLAATLIDPTSGRAMDVLTTAPGVQVYTGNFIDPDAVDPIVGRGKTKYPKHASICLETQLFPDAIHRLEEWKQFPSPILRPGEKYCHVAIHRFYTTK